MKRLWSTHRFICNKYTQAMFDPTMALIYAMDDTVYAASLVRLGNDDGERPDFWLVLPAGVQHMLPQYMDVKSLCRTDSIMTDVSPPPLVGRKKERIRRDNNSYL